jgi:hypothetical protein
MDNALATGIFLLWFTAWAAFVGVAHLMARGKGRHPLAWTLAAAFCGPLAVFALSSLKATVSNETPAINLRPLRTAPVRSRRSFTV